MNEAERLARLDLEVWDGILAKARWWERAAQTARLNGGDGLDQDAMAALLRERAALIVPVAGPSAEEKRRAQTRERVRRHRERYRLAGSRQAAAS